MEIIIEKNASTASALGARIIGSYIRARQASTLGLATGGTPLLLYQELIKLHKKEGLDFSHVSTFNLDEYLGLSPSHSSSYNTYMWKNFLSHINIPEYRVHIPDGLAPDVEEFCKQYEAAIQAAGGIDIQILGIGTDGHIGFNEPTSSLSSRTRIKTLTQQTIQDNQKYFSEDETVPHHVITMGIGTIMESRMIIMLAFGDKKAKAIAAAVEGPITSMVPASILQMHQKTVIIIDEAASSKLKRADYYRWVYQNKPDWQKY
jgi:glucosamine-6-phosphate deaminase